MLSTGCASWTTQDTSRLLAPVGVIGGYFGAVAAHEGGHALVGGVVNAESIRVTILPSRDEEDRFHLGFTTFRTRRDLSPIEERFFNISGVLTNASLHIALRESLKSNQIPYALQPAMQWFSLCNQIACYGEILFGLGRLKGSDLGKEPLWVTLAILGGALTYDLCDILILDDYKRYFGVFGGNEFYKPKTASKISMSLSPLPNGGVFGLHFSW